MNTYIGDLKFKCHWHDFDCENNVLCSSCPHCLKDEDKRNYHKPRKKAHIYGWWGMTVCPSCNEPTYGEKRCFFCGQAIKLKEYLPKPLIVGWKGWKGIFISGGFWIYHNGKSALHAQCHKKMTPSEARKQLKAMPKLLKVLKEKENEIIMKKI